MNVEPEHEDLERRPPEVRVDELRQEREEEQRRLRVEDVDDDPLGEVAATPARWPLRVGVLGVGAPEQRPDPDHDQVRPRRATLTTVNAVADETRIAESPTTAKVRCTSVPHVDPEHRGEPGRAGPGGCCA